MTYEVEIKARVRDPNHLEARAAKLGIYLKESIKEDIYFRPVGETNPAPDTRYRLRRENETAIVTFKQKQVVDGFIVSDEVEFSVDDLRAFFRFTHFIGFEPFVVKHKQSRVYQVGRTHIELNNVKHLGYFTEIEILCEQEEDIPAARDEIMALLPELTLTEADLVEESYIVMIQQAYPVQYRYVANENSDWPFEEVG